MASPKLPCSSFTLKNSFILVKYKIKSSKPYLLLHLTLSLFSPSTLSPSVIIVHGLLIEYICVLVEV